LQYCSRNKPNLVIGFVSNGSSSRSYPIKSCRTLLQKLSHKFNIIVTDKARFDLDDLDIINLTGKLSIREWMSVVYNADVVASTDTGIYWIGLAFKKPCIVAFSTMHPDLRVPYYKDCLALYPELKCKPCYDKQMVVDTEAWLKCKEAIRNSNPAPCIKVFDPNIFALQIELFAIEKGLL